MNEQQPANENFEIDNPDIKALLRSLADRIGGKMPEGWGFTLMLFEYDPGNSFFYISSARREDMMTTVREWLEREAKKS